MAEGEEVGREENSWVITVVGLQRVFAGQELL
jgi:hypothetical protein